jgi:5'-3' exonuclease
MNGLIHRAAQKTYAYGDFSDLNRQKLLSKMSKEELEFQFLNNIGSILLDTLAAVNPTDLLVLAVDGVAPVAKMDQQRKRRFRSASQSALFNTSSITPGTDLMFRIDTYLENWIATNRTQLPPHVIYSSHMVPGEGEHKIFQFMREGRYRVPLNQFELAKTSLASETYVVEGAHVVHGLDADLIMLSLLAPLDNIYLMREDLADVIVIDNLKGLIQDEDIDIDTFVLLSFLIGNDFLPHQPALEDIGHAFDEILLLSAGQRLVEDGKIDWPNFLQFLHRAADIEPKLLDHELNRAILYPSPVLAKATTKRTILSQGKREESKQLNFPLFVDSWHEHVLGPHGDSSVATKLGLNFLPVTDKRVEEMVHHYLDGLDWIFHYYRGGLDAVDPMWYYPYHYTPLLTDLAKHASTYTPHRQRRMLGLPYNAVHQLLAVLPRSSQDLIPVEASHLMDLDSPIIDMYPDDFVIDYGGKNADYQGVALIPHVEMKRIIDAVDRNTHWTHTRAAKYSSTTSAESIRNEVEVSLEKRRKQLEMMTRGGYERGGPYPSRGSSRGGYERNNPVATGKPSEAQLTPTRAPRESRSRPTGQASVASTVIAHHVPTTSSSLKEVTEEGVTPPPTIYLK